MSGQDPGSDAAADIDRPPEFSRPVRAVDVPGGGGTYDIEATAAERDALVDRLALSALDALSGRVTLRPLAGGPMFVATGRFTARYAQSCVVTLEPVAADADIEIALEYAPEEPESEQPKEREFTLEDADPPEPIIDGVIDLGELLTQQLALALDPYPRKPDADLSDMLADLPEGRRRGVETEAPSGPFAKLARLKGGDD